MVRAYKTQLCLLVASFLHDRRGNVAIIAGFAMVVLILVAGSGIDFGRAYNTRIAIERALDSATLAGARQLSTSMATKEQVTETVSDFFNANMELAGYSDVTVGDVVVNINRDAGTLDVSASATIPTTFISISGIKALTVNAFSESTFSHYDVEVAMVVDVTLSMRSDMPALRNAAQSLVDILIPAGTTSSESKVRISLVPYSQGVNLGNYASTVSNGTTTRCVTEREGPEKYTDAVYNYADEYSVFFGGGTSACSSTSKLLPLSSDRGALSSAVSSLAANGMTAGQTGIQWGWYTLSPNWSSLWPSDSAPASYARVEDDVLKFAVLMTDGGFNRHYDYADICELKWVDGRLRSVCKKEWQEIQSNEHDYNGPAFSRARKLCDAMKDTKIKIYSIYFKNSSNTAAGKLMEYCASSSKTYYLAKDQAQLIAAFQKIANEIQSIYLSR